MKAFVTDIQRFSLTDGPGIRTTVFLQGCNMRCPWCHNPETIPMKPVELFYKEKCIGCGKCVEGCTSGARVMSSREMTVEEVMREVVQDKVYYAESGGGATVSGGEPMLHPEFVAALADACHAEDVKIAVETNMSLPWQTIHPVLERMDFIMCDLKLNLTIPHKEQTGVDNPTIFNSIGRASKLGIPMVVRTPLVPGVTDTVENLHAIAEYIAKMDNIVRYEVLNFNPLGGAKREALGVANAFADAKPYSAEELAKFRAALADIKGLEVKVC
ncbi:MAG: glycyl-radical enzyme activating protein [Kiritimatiellae bacterium]|nr:glycyl-radical enzyme activating protein [Kiritimatiellia bacterium]